MNSAVWPLHGLRWLLNHPRLWWRPLLAHAAALAVLMATAITIAWLLWPAPQAWYWYTLKVGGALGLSMVAALTAWALMVPLLLAPVLDSLAIAVLRERGIAVRELPLIPAIADSLRVVWHTLPLRFGLLAFSLLGAFLGPLAPLLGAFALSRMAVVDAYDIALAVRGWSSDRRLVFYAAHSGHLHRSALVAGGLQLALAFTLVGWLLWLPALVCGAALQHLESDGKNADDEI